MGEGKRWGEGAAVGPRAHVHITREAIYFLPQGAGKRRGSFEAASFCCGAKDFMASENFFLK